MSKQLEKYLSNINNSIKKKNIRFYKNPHTLIVGVSSVIIITFLIPTVISSYYS